MFGIDVSHNNGLIDWKAVSENPVPVDFVFIKATEGVGYTDRSFLTNATEAKQNGLKTGYYHFASLNTTNNIADAKAEADYFLSVIKKAPSSDLPLILDIETNKVLLPKTKVKEWIRSFFEELSKNGYNDHALYSYTPFLDANLPVSHGLGNIRLWLAAYVTASKPKLPKGWADYWIWQYSCKGTIKGIKGNVDLNKSASQLY